MQDAYSPFMSPAKYVPFGPSTPVSSHVARTPASRASAMAEASPAGFFVSKEEIAQLRATMQQLQERVKHDECEKKVSGVSLPEYSIRS